MRKVLQIAVVLLSVAIMTSGCDFFRMLAGRPTSKDIEAKRAEILRSAQDDKQKPYSAAAEQGDARMDAAVPGRPAGEQAVVPAGEQTGKKIVGKKRYYVIMGAFSSKDNAVKYAERIKTYGYEPEFFGFTEGRTAVGIGGTDDPEEVKAFMKELKGQGFCPEGVWILDRKK
ncbi:MAG: SPOR domain-containing protein [Bacteroidales bacterium]|nr:SPOR domain-containing protein [Bacteroidales bacterium]